MNKILNYIIGFILIVALLMFMYLELMQSTAHKYKTVYQYPIRGGAIMDESKESLINTIINKSKNHMVRLLLNIMKNDSSSKELLNCLKKEKADELVLYGKQGFSENTNVNKCIVENVNDDAVVMIARNNLLREEFFAKNKYFTNYNNTLNLSQHNDTIAPTVRYMTEENEAKTGTFFKFRVYGLPNQVVDKSIGIVFDSNGKPDTDIVLKSQSNINDFTISMALNLIKENYSKIKNLTIPNNLKYVKLHPLRTVPLFCTL